jgi:hypothetical protein
MLTAKGEKAMTIDDFIVEKRETQEEISTILLQFIQKTGLLVDDININIIFFNEIGRGPKLSHIDTKLTIKFPD